MWNLIISLFIFVFVIELISFSLNKLDNTKLFRIRVFNEITNDERVFTLKKNISHIEKRIETDNKSWELYTSGKGIRVGKNHKIRNKNDFLFLGDSVPFGWGVNYENSLPSYFQNLNENFNIINGAVPSYALNQTIERFFIEFKDIDDLEYVYLQVIDPALHFSLLGDKWRPEYNWATLFKYIYKEYEFIDIKFPLYGELYFSEYLKKKIFRIKIKKIQRVKASEEAKQNYIKHIEDNLNKLHKYLNAKNVNLILSSIVVPDNIYKTLDAQHQEAIAIFNKVLKEFSLIHKDVYFFDVSKKIIFNDDFYIDEWHLSSEGASLIADELTIFINNKLIFVSFDLNASYFIDRIKETNYFIIIIFFFRNNFNFSIYKYI